MMMKTLVLALVVASPSMHAFGSRLSPGPTAPAGGLHCRGSLSALGTSNAYGNDQGSTIVNMWAIYRRGGNTALGWIDKSIDGRLWYEDPVGLSYQDLSQTADLISHNPAFSFVGCFKHDLRLR